MRNFYNKNYWSLGFQSRLYDFLTPESYFESMRRVIQNIPEEKYLNLLDAGCGSGKILCFLKDKIELGMSYTGLDVLESSVNRTLMYAVKLGIENQVNCFSADLTRPLPLSEEKFDVVVAHFSIYVLGASKKRQLVLKNLKSVMNPGSILIMVNPSIEYDETRIIDESVQLEREKNKNILSFVMQYIIYPVTKLIGLRYIKKQLDSSEWKAYTQDEFVNEIEEAGLLVQKIEKVYADGAFLGVARLNECKYENEKPVFK
jgi:ubiquinone/menaquinone biosynthesis C-methylase UbiE